jgi:elongation of very long chain fatty acids protein 6
MDLSKYVRVASEAGDSMRYYQLFHHIPALELLYSGFEKSFDVAPIHESMVDNNYAIPLLAIVLYLLMVYFGPKLMKNVQPFQLRFQLQVWNLFLATFSAYGAIRTVPHMLYRIGHHTFEQTVCEAPQIAYGSGACGLAVQLFIISKIPELIDTLFIVLKKKPLIFLHWYHHVTVLLYSWNSYVTESAAGLYFVSMNYSVHAIMYFYFYLTAARMVPKWFNPSIITVLQISQMVVGTGVVAASMYFHVFGGEEYAPGECNNKKSNLLIGMLIYGSYLYLFVEFFVSKLRRNRLDMRKEKTAAKIA